MNDYPTTLTEWLSYVATLEGADLRSKTVAVNTQKFVDGLLADGLTMREAQSVVRAFAARMHTLGMAIPKGGAFDLPAIAEVAPYQLAEPPSPLEVAWPD